MDDIFETASAMARAQAAPFRIHSLEDSRLEARDALRTIIAARDLAPDVPIPTPLMAAIEAARKVL